MKLRAKQVTGGWQLTTFGIAIGPVVKTKEEVSKLAHMYCADTRRCIGQA